MFADDYATLDVISCIGLVLRNERVRRIAVVTSTPRDLDLRKRREGAKDRLVLMPRPASGMDMLDLVFSIAAWLTVDACRGVEPSVQSHQS